MSDLALFAIASHRTRWLAARSAALAENVANADTPGFKARDVASFDATLQATGMALAQTSAGHLAPTDAPAGAFELGERRSENVKHSGNTVDLETEMMQLGDTRTMHSMVSGVIAAFNRMLLSSSKA